MKKNLLKSCFFLATLFGALSVSAKNYCHEELKQGDNVIYLSCEQLSVSTYSLTIEGENLSGLGGTFFNPGAVDLRTTITTNTPAKIVCTISAESAPQIYTPLYVMMPGEVNFGEIKDIEWGKCGDTPIDTKAPVMESATFISATHNSATLSVSATPADSIAMYQVMNGDTQLGSFVAQDGNIIVPGLTSNTQYTLRVYAVKTTGVVSENYKEVSFTTESLSYCQFPTGHLGNADFGDPAGRILLTIAKKSATSVGVKVITNGDAVIDWYHVEINGVAKEVGDKTSGKLITDEIVFDGLTSLDFACNIFWHTPALGDGQWVTNAFDVQETQLCSETAITDAVVTLPTSHTTKKVVNGQLIIIRNEIRYNALGVQIK